MRVICKFNDPSNISRDIPDDFDYGLEIGKEYTVMGMLTFKRSNHLYFLIDENGRPSWFPHQIFDVLNNALPQNWFVKINREKDNVDFYNLIGFKELCNSENFFNQLLEREESVMRTYFRRKIELEKEIADEEK